MTIRNHAVYSFLTDPLLPFQMVEKGYPKEYAAFRQNMDSSHFAETAAMYRFLNAADNKNFVVTETAVNLMLSLKIDTVNWKFLHGIPDGKRTYIFPAGQFLRMKKQDDQIAFCYGSNKKKEDGNNYLQYTVFYVDTVTGAENIKHESRTILDVDNLAVFKQLCFIHLSETIEETILPGKVHGTRKTGKISNDLSVPVTIINSKWNVTTIRTTGFNVNGHFRIQPCGEGRTNYKIIFIDTFKKEGYTRTAKKDKILKT